MFDSTFDGEVGGWQVAVGTSWACMDGKGDLYQGRKVLGRFLYREALVRALL